MGRSFRLEAAEAAEPGGHDASRVDTGWERHRRAGKLSEGPAIVDGEGTHSADSALVHVQRASVRAHAGVGRPNPGGVADNRAADQGQSPIGCDLVAEISPDPVFTANRYRPSGVMVTQHGAVWSSATGLAPMEVSDPLKATL